MSVESEMIDVPFVSSSSGRLITMLHFAEIKSGQRMIDLGSGDGRLVIECAKSGAEAHGVELSNERVKLSEENIKRAGVSYQAKIFAKSFWDINLGGYDVIMLYGITHIMGALERKIATEARRGTRIISNTFKFPNLKPLEEKNNVYLYML